MKAFGAEVILTDGMEAARDLAVTMSAQGEGLMLDQFANPDNPLAHYQSTGPEIWRDTAGGITHFVSSMGTTGTIMGTQRFLKEKNSAIQIVGVQPCDGASIPGIRKWPQEYVPDICDWNKIDRVMEVTQQEAEDTTRRLAREEGIFLPASRRAARWRRHSSCRPRSKTPLSSRSLRIGATVIFLQAYFLHDTG